MTRTQLHITAYMLDLAAIEFANHTSNEYELYATPETLDFVRGMIAASDYPEDDPHLSPDGQTIYVSDVEVMRYCRGLVIKEAEKLE